MFVYVCIFLLIYLSIYLSPYLVDDYMMTNCMIHGNYLLCILYIYILDSD